MEIFWFIPTSGDGRYIGTAVGGRTTSFSYLKQIAQAADGLGYHGVLLPTGRSCEDAWVVASGLAAVTERLRFLVAMRPGMMQPANAVRMATTFDRISGGRLMLNVVTGGDPVELASDGILIDKNARYELTDEFLTVFRSLMSAEEEIDHEGAFFQVKGGKRMLSTVQHPYPPLYLGGSSAEAIDVTAKHIDVYLTWGEPPALVKEKIERVRQAAAEQGRTVRFGIRLHVIVRETEDEAWAAADDLIKYLDDETVAAAQKVLAQYDSEGVRRQQQLHRGVDRSRDALEVSPNLWAGIGLVRSGAGTALVGDPQTVAARMQEYADLGIETFILSGYPHLEEAYCFAEMMFPLLPMKPVQGANHNYDVHQAGEIVANHLMPKK